MMFLSKHIYGPLRTIRSSHDTIFEIKIIFQLAAQRLDDVAKQKPIGHIHSEVSF